VQQEGEVAMATAFANSSPAGGRRRQRVSAELQRQRRLIGVLLALNAVLLALALLSYTPHDEAFAYLDWGDIVGLLRGEPELRLRMESIQNWLGLVGAVLAHTFYVKLIGYAALVVPALLGWWAYSLLRRQHISPVQWRQSALWLALAVAWSVLMGTLRGIPFLAELPLEWSGMTGAFLASLLRQLLGVVGSVLVAAVATVAIAVVSIPLPWARLAMRLRLLWARLRLQWRRSRQRRSTASEAEAAVETTEEPIEPARILQRAAPEPVIRRPEPAVAPAAAVPSVRLERQEPTPSAAEPPGGQTPPKPAPQMTTAPYVPPSPELLLPDTDAPEISEEELRQNARLLQEKLETFRIGIENLTVTPGPVVTQYEFVPAAGVKISQIESLADDIALALKAPGVRIIAPVPGRGTVAVEIPNQRRALVRFRSIVEAPQFWNPDLQLPLGLGKTIAGEVYCADLTRMPHLLIAGATGSGKSVGIHAMVLSLLYRMQPSELKLVLIDPKKVELAPYAVLEEHFLAVAPDVGEPIVTTPSAAVLVLKSVELEMERRYDMLAQLGQRNIAEYNRRVREGRLGAEAVPLPYLVVVIDELADLMLTAGRAAEEPITRLAQLARAVGIHLIVATQRPSVDVLTGLIKANFPARIAYQVASRVDSRVILDMAGAEQLLGSGDMLFLPGGVPKPIRLQNAYVSLEEVEAVCQHIAAQPGTGQPYVLPSLSEQGEREGSDGGGRDPLFAEAARLVVRHQQGSVSLLQRRLKIGYSRAARIMDELEAAGIVGPPDGSRARQVLVGSEAELERLLSSV
jgi:S-DNA-T family DNA segregation ATPase FtsK/SpoIIIE